MITDFLGKNRSRNWDIYRRRVVEKRTLESIGERHGLSRERIRQIVAYAEQLLKNRAVVEEQTKKDLGIFMRALEVSTELHNVLGNMGVWDMTLKEFTDTYTPQDVLAMPNCGRKRLNQLITAIKDVNPNVSYIWTTRDR